MKKKIQNISITKIVSLNNIFVKNKIRLRADPKRSLYFVRNMARSHYILPDKNIFLKSIKI